MQPHFDMAQILQLAQSPAGQKLIALLQQRGGEDLQQALFKASSGDYGQAQRSITQLLEDPEAKKLLQQLGGNHE